MPIDLGGVGVLVTRPGSAGEELVRDVEAGGGRASLFPALVIEALDSSDALEELKIGFPSQGWCMFVSPHAVEHGVRWLQHHGLWQCALEGSIAAVGGGSARRLQQHGVNEVVAPQSGTGSKALLQHPRLRGLEGARVVIFRGEGGSGLLGEQLALRGADVAYAEVYRRQCPDRPLALADLDGIDIAVSTSAEGVLNLYRLLEPDARERFNRLEIVVSSTSAAAAATARGFRNSPIITPHVSNQQILETIAAWKTRHRQPPR